VSHGKRIAIETRDTGAPPPKTNWRRAKAFVLVPGFWLERLETTRSAATIKLALRILHLNWKSKGQSITLSNVVVASVCYRRAKWRALRELEQLGLIRVEAKARNSPRILVLEQ